MDSVNPLPKLLDLLIGSSFGGFEIVVTDVDGVGMIVFFYVVAVVVGGSGSCVVAISICYNCKKYSQLRSKYNFNVYIQKTRKFHLYHQRRKC